MHTAFAPALDEADQIVASDKHRPAEIYAAATGTSLSVEEIQASISIASLKFSHTPENFQNHAQFLNRMVTIENMGSSWKDLVFPNVQNEPGS